MVTKIWYQVFILAFVDQIDLCELFIYTFADISYIALKMIFLGKFTGGSMILLPW